MANWSTSIPTENIKVVSQERVEDTDPQTYRERGQYFWDKGQYAAAEEEYLKAVKLSNHDDVYINHLLTFYYGTKRKDYEKKANKLYRKWKAKHKAFMYLCACIYLVGLAYLGIGGLLFSGIVCYLIPFGPLAYLSTPRKSFIHSARKKMGVYVLKLCFAGFFGLVVCFFILLSIYNTGTLFGIEELGNTGSLFYANKIIGIVAAIAAIISFNKWINCLAKKVKETSVFRKFLRIVQLVGSVVAIVLAVGFTYVNMEEWADTIYEEAHDGWLTEEELEKLEQLGKKYDELTDVDIRYYQRISGDSNNQLEYDGGYLYLVYSSMGFSFEMGGATLYTNVLSQSELEQLNDEYSEICSKDLTDYEECEKFYELAYKYIKEKERFTQYEEDTPVEDMYESDIAEETVDSKEEQDTETVSYDTFYANLSRLSEHLDDATLEQYATVLTVTSQGVLPNGDTYERIGTNGNRYSVCDVDSDGIDELIVVIQDTYEAGKMEIVYEYDSQNNLFTEQFIGFPGLTYYSNGMIEEKWSHNQGLGTTLWPYNLYEYNNNQYRKVMSVDSWDKNTYPVDYEGNSFPDYEDIDGDGVLYYLNLDGGFTLYDGEIYSHIIDAYLRDATVISPQWLSY